LFSFTCCPALFAGKINNKGRRPLLLRFPAIKKGIEKWRA
jgi:hypothetical protein